MSQEIVREAIIGEVLWCGHDHRTRPCCLDAILGAVPDGWAKIDGEWIRVKARVLTLSEIAKQAQYLLDLDGDRIPQHVQLWLRDLVADFGATSQSAVHVPNPDDQPRALGPK